MEEQEKVLMVQKELKRLHLMELVKGGKISLREAGEKIRVNYFLPIKSAGISYDINLFPHRPQSQDVSSVLSRCGMKNDHG
jgi:hypothetical protein